MFIKKYKIIREPGAPVPSARTASSGIRKSRDAIRDFSPGCKEKFKPGVKIIESFGDNN